jgi:DNA-binding transcriptional MerR regulator
MADNIGIGELAERTGVKVPTIRFYEERRLLSMPRRTRGGQRRYDENAVRRLHFIRHARTLGFEFADIKQLLALSENPSLPCVTITRISQHQLERIEAKIAQLRAIRSELKRMITGCEGRAVADCRILDALAGEVRVASNKAGKRKSQ